MYGKTRKQHLLDKLSNYVTPVERHTIDKLNKEGSHPLVSIFLLRYLKKASVSKETIAMTLVDETNEVLTNLKFIGRIQKGEKLNVGGMCTEPDGVVTKLVRTIRSFHSPETREGALDFITSTVKLAIKISNDLLETKSPMDKVLCFNILTDLRQSIVGVNNFKETYGKDTHFCCKISTFLQSTDASIADLENKFKSVEYNEQSENN